MEGSVSEAVFDACILNPQRFINEVLNAADDLVDGAFHFCLQTAAMITGCGEEGSEELVRGVSTMRNITQGILDNRMSVWEKYCLQHCFVVPDGFVLPQTQESSVNHLPLQKELEEAELDSQLNSVREKLGAVGKESAELLKELQALEKQDAISSKYDASIAEALQLYEQNSAHEMLQEIGKVALVLHSKAEAMQMKNRKEMEDARIGKIYSPSKRQHIDDNHGLLASLEDIQAVAGILKNM